MENSDPLFFTAAIKVGASCLTLGHEGFVRLVASVALLDEVLGHPIGPRWRQGVLWCFIVLP